MGEQDKEPEPRELVEALREKLQNAHLSRHELERLVPPSLAKRDQHSIPPYEPGQYKKQCEETRKRMEKLEAQRLPAFVSKKVQDKFLNEFYELKAQGKLSHLSPEQLEKLEAEIKASAANSKEACRTTRVSSQS
ncbi:unnamed protein product [Meganyctiphanes norvegica]|uniref:Uncharacterized protein n=1 Tax=Meganyctiphanes norvegica TaxID=48144 RepID=A0AAV2PTX6_MEGNR